MSPDDVKFWWVVVDTLFYTIILIYLVWRVNLYHKARIKQGEEKSKDLLNEIPKEKLLVKVAKVTDEIVALRKLVNASPCKKCGAYNPINASFCRNCGEKQESKAITYTCGAEYKLFSGTIVRCILKEGHTGEHCSLDDTTWRDSKQAKKRVKNNEKRCAHHTSIDNNDPSSEVVFCDLGVSHEGPHSAKDSRGKTFKWLYIGGKIVQAIPTRHM